MNKKTQTLFVFILFFLISNAQEVVSSTGQQANTNQAHINFTIGEAIVGQTSVGNNKVNIGYQQAFLKIDAIDIKETQNWNVSVYPNPSQNFINIDWDNSNIKQLNYQIFSVEGKLIKTGSGKELININISDIAAGNYFLYLQNKDKKQTYKIQKIK